MKCIALVASLAILAPLGASAQTSDQLVKGATDTANVLNYGMGYNLQRFSPLTQINKENAKNLVPVWSLQPGRRRRPRSRSRSSTRVSSTSPLTPPRWRSTSRPASRSGRPRSSIRRKRRVLCAAASSIAASRSTRASCSDHARRPCHRARRQDRQGALAQGRRYQGRLFDDGAPLVANGVVITGISGAEFGTRGFIDGWDPATGKHCGAATLPQPRRAGRRHVEGRHMEAGRRHRRGSPAPMIRS